jgi:hypothetical protein
VRLVEDQQELVPVLPKPVGRLLKNRPLERPHEHVLQHGVIGNEDVRGDAGPRSRPAHHLLPGQQFPVTGLRVQPLIELGRVSPWLGQVLAEEGFEILGRVSTEPAQLLAQAFVQAGVVFEKRRYPLSVLGRVPWPRVRGTAGVHPEERMPPAGPQGTKGGGDALIAEEEPRRAS